MFGKCDGLDDAVKNLAVLYAAQVDLMREARGRGNIPAFNVAYFFADVLDCLGRLDRESLILIMGEKVGNKVWDEVKPSGCTH
ncbi:hypothetical protein BECAL_00507 [Bellilinea caldifistulae]|uniref:Uncharacterized protein n=1 Tax=Bellilinea caldifistulae TaxID=360411 RepID=A0A0P6X2I3_9CHLR|nr:hypothetical protein [Bellilinea caldifistulae]KPL75223.1 hypothetical protein AC812_09700 [Bellilinea caldifistulae]GAP09364.1 hypothetical protein BECAL_00507 [Bellilinea caldifistulae]